MKVIVLLPIHISRRNLIIFYLYYVANKSICSTALDNNYSTSPLRLPAFRNRLSPETPNPAVTGKTPNPAVTGKKPEPGCHRKKL